MSTGGLFTAVTSFQAANGALCRAFEIDGDDRSTIVSVACGMVEG